MDPGNTHIAGLPDAGAGFTHLNPEAHILHGPALGQSQRTVPSFAICEPGFLRLGAALQADYPGAPWKVAGLYVDARPLCEAALAHDNHLRDGLEDAPVGAPHTNAAMTPHAATRTYTTGHRPATASEIRAACAV